MTFHFRLTRVPGTPTPLYKGEVDGTHEVFVILDEHSRSIRPADSDGTPVTSLRMDIDDGNLSGTPEDPDAAAKAFPLLAAHLIAEWRKRGHPPQEIRKVFG